MSEEVQGLLAFIYGHETGLNPIVGAPANIEYAYGDTTIRDKPLIADLEDKISGAVAAVYGEGYKARVYSGGQEGEQRTGSVRHDHGKAADVHIFAPDGRQLKGDDLAPLGQFWAASKYGGVGMEMAGGGIHLDVWETPPPGGGMSWNYAADGGQYTPAQRAAVEAGLRGEMPVLKGEAKPVSGRRINPAVYDTVSSFVPSHLRPAKPLTQMTVQEVLDWQESIDAAVQSEAAGAVQVMPDTLRGLIEAGKVDPDALFDGTTQDAIAVSLLEGRGLKEWQAGELTTEEFGNNLAMEWASLPVLGPVYKGDKMIDRGGAYYGETGINPSRGFASADDLETVLSAPGELHVSLSAKDGASWDPGVGIQRTGIAEGQMGQFDPSYGASVPEYPWQGSVALNVSRRNQLALPGAGAGVPSMPQLPSANYGTRTGPGGGGDLNMGAMRALMDEWEDSFFVRGAQDWMARRNQDYDVTFDPIDEAVKEGTYSQDEILFLGDAMNRTDYQRLKSQIDRDRARNYRREVYNGWAAPLIGGMLNPDSLVSMLVPGGVIVSGMRRAGVNAGRSALAGAMLSGTSELALETGRSGYDSQKDGMSSLINVGMATALGGLFSAGVAGVATPAARRNLANRMATEMAQARGIGTTSVKIDIGKGQSATVAFDKGDFVVAATDGAMPKARTFRIMDVDGKPVVAVVSGEDLRRGVWRIGDRIMVSARAIAERVKAGDMPAGVENANELMEYELGRIGSFTKKMREFLGKEDGSVRVPGAGPDEPNPFVKIDEAGQIQVDRKRLERVHKDGGTVMLGDGVPGGRVTPIEVNAAVFDTVDEMEAVIRAAHDLGSKARDDAEFRQSVEGLFGGVFGRKLDEAEPEEVIAARERAAFEAELDAAEHLENWRRQNNKILRDARVEAFARIMDSPYKRIHRNALSSWARDMVDLLAADGGFLRGVDGAGETLGPSVYSRAKTWQGMVDRLYRKERELYAKYLGLDLNPGALGINLSDFKRKRVDGSKAVPMRDWRRLVTRVHITGVSSGIPEIDAMATHLKGVLDEYAMVADEYGVISGSKTLARRAKRLQEMIDQTNDATKRAGMEAELGRVQKMMAQHANEPGEDYFTRVWSRKAIADNREAFIERIVKPWMRQQNEIERWEPGKDDIKPVLDQLRASGAPQDRIDAMQARFDKAPEKGEWRWIKASTKADDIDRRAREMVEEILGEAEPDVAAAHRDPQRPTFGRHRQFDIPNRMLLKDGPEGNGIADFIETDYLLVQRIYADRMGPAIEMARTFGRPGDGVNGVDGFDQAMDRFRSAERAEWEKMILGGNGTPPVAAGMTRIYRFAPKQQAPAKVSEWIAESEAYQNTMKASGRWFSDDLEEAKWYVKEHPEGQLYYVDVPASSVEAMRVSNIEKTVDGLDPKAFSARPEKELFVSPEISRQAKPFVEGELATEWGKKVEAARQAAYDAELARIKGAPERLEKAQAELKARMRDYARAREEGDLARMTDEQAEDWLEKAGERAARIFKRKMAAEGREVSPAAERAYVKKAVERAQETFSRIRLDGGGDAAMKRLDEAKRLMDMARAKRNDELRTANMTEASAKSEAELARGLVDPVDVIEKAGGPKFADHFAPLERDMLHLRDRVSNRVIRNPDRWDNRAATVLKDWSRLVFMGLSGLNALQEIGALIMRHGATKTFRAAFMNVDAEMGAAMKAGIEEMRKAGAILDVAMGGALASFAETGMDATFATAPERWIRAASNRYFNWNLLAPITARFKELDAMIRVNDTLEKIDRVALGVGSKEDLEYLSRFGISKRTAQRIANEPIMQNEGGFWLANTDAWGDEDLVRTFRAAIAQGNENTILMATAADKPTIVDGTAYIRRGGAADKYAKRLGLRQVGDYWQVQSGLMSLPFSFWNYGIAATNKILISGIDEPSGQKLAGMAAMIGIGYMVAQLRTDDNEWQSLSMGDRIAKAVDQSGVVGLVGTYANLFQGASLATMGVNPLPFERTRGMRQPGLMDMAEQFAGAGPSAMANLIRGVAQGDLAQARWGLPLANYVATSWMWEAVIDGTARKRAGLDE